MQREMIERAKVLLADGTVNRVIGWKAGEFDYDITPAVFTTAEELANRTGELEREIEAGVIQRKPLYQERRRAADEEGKARCSAEIDRQTASLREKRRELTLCHGILADVPHISQQVEQAEAMRQKQVKKEEKRHEYQR